MDKVSMSWWGSGAAVNKKLGNASYALWGEGDPLLVDVSGLTAMQLASDGQLSRFKDVLITHVHSDHISGLCELGYARVNREGDWHPPVRVHTGSGAIMDDLIAIMEPMMQNQSRNDGRAFRAKFGDYFEISVGEEINIGGLPPIHLHKTRHAPGMDCYGIHVPDAGLWVSGDSVEVKALPKDTQLAFRDANGPNTKHAVHACVDMLRTLPYADNEITFLYHLGLDWREVDATGFAGKVLPGDVFVLDGEGYKHDKTNTFLYDSHPYDGPR